MVMRRRRSPPTTGGAPPGKKRRTEEAQESLPLYEGGSCASRADAHLQEALTQLNALEAELRGHLIEAGKAEAEEQRLREVIKETEAQIRRLREDAWHTVWRPENDTEDMVFVYENLPAIRHFYPILDRLYRSIAPEREAIRFAKQRADRCGRHAARLAAECTQLRTVLGMRT